MLRLCLWWMLHGSRWHPDLPEPSTRTLWMLPIHPMQSKHSVQIPVYIHLECLTTDDSLLKSCLKRMVLLKSLHFPFYYCLMVSSSQVILTHPLPRWMALCRMMECSVGVPVWTCELRCIHFPKKHYIIFSTFIFLNTNDSEWAHI